MLVFAPAASDAAPDGSFWGKVGGAGAARARPDPSAGAGTTSPRLLERVETEENAGRLTPRAPCWNARCRGFTGAERSATWFRLGMVRSKLGRYREAAVAYAAVVADGTADSPPSIPTSPKC